MEIAVSLSNEEASWVNLSRSLDDELREAFIRAAEAIASGRPAEPFVPRQATPLALAS